MHSEIQIAAVTIISYNHCLNFARYTVQNGSCMSTCSTSCSFDGPSSNVFSERVGRPCKTNSYIPEEHGVRFVDVSVDPHHVLLIVSPGGVLPLGTEQGSCSLWTTHYHSPAFACTHNIIIMIEYRLIINYVDTRNFYLLMNMYHGQLLLMHGTC